MNWSTNSQFNCLAITEQVPKIIYISFYGMSWVSFLKSLGFAWFYQIQNINDISLALFFIFSLILTMFCFMNVNTDFLFLIQYLRAQKQPSKDQLLRWCSSRCLKFIICLAAPENPQLIEYLNTYEALITNFFAQTL